MPDAVVPNHVNQLRIPPAPPKVQARLAAFAQNLSELKSRLHAEQLIGSFRRVVSSRQRTDEDDLGRYLDKLDEASLEVKNRLDEVTKARRISVSPSVREDTLELVVTYLLPGSNEQQRGTVVCQLDRPIAIFLASVLRDRENPNLGSGRVMSKLREAEIPRFDPDWDRHLEVVRELAATLQRHEATARELMVKIDAVEATLDREIYALFGLDDADIARIQTFHPRVEDAAGSEIEIGRNEEDDD